MTVLFSVLAFLGICLFLVLLTLRSYGVGHIIRNTDILGYLEDFSTGEHAYYIVDQINGLPFSETEVTLYDIEEFLKNEHVTGEIERIVGGYATALMLGNLSHHITVEDIVIAARNLEPELHDFFDHRMTDDDFNSLAQTLDDILDLNSLTLEGIIEDFDMDMSPLPLILLSPVFLWVVGLLSGGFLLVMFLLYKNNIASAILSIGIPVTLSGLISFGAGTLVVSSLEPVDGEPSGFSRLLEDPVFLFTQLGLITAAAGVAVIIVSLVVRLVRR
ncbi:MAG: hypothetical protein FWE83_07505 [Oscillospiraceae bacterium]|nr:hypothetical protein [Oscillospiraceae bacterium]